MSITTSLPVIENRVPLGIKITLILLALLALTFAGMATATYHFSKQYAENAAREALHKTLTVHAHLFETKTQSLIQSSQQIAIKAEKKTPLSTDRFKSLVANLTEDNMPDLAILLDSDADLLSHSQEALFIRRPYHSHPLVKPVLETLQLNSGLWVEENRLYHVVLTPLVRNEKLHRILITGSVLDERYLEELKTYTGTDAMLLLSSASSYKQHASTLAGNTSSSLLAVLTERFPYLGGIQTSKQLSLLANQDHYRLETLALEAPYSKEPRPLLLLFVTLESFNQEYLKWLLKLVFVGVLALAGALVFSYFLARRVIRASRLSVRARPEIFDTDHTDLRSADTVFLAVGYDALPGIMADVGPTEECVSAIAEIGRRYQATLILVGADMLVFAQSAGSVTTLYGQLHRIRKELADLLETDPVALRCAITEGFSCVGTVIVEEGHVITLHGKAPKHVLRLLQEAKPGQCLVAPSVYQTMKQAMREVGIVPQAVKGRFSKKTLCMLDVDAGAKLLVEKGAQ